MRQNPCAWEMPMDGAAAVHCLVSVLHREQPDDMVPYDLPQNQNFLEKGFSRLIRTASIRGTSL